LDFSWIILGNGDFRPARRARLASTTAGGKLRYLFEDFLLDTDQRELRRGENLLAVGPKVFDLLALLTANRERVISKDDLIAEIWDGRSVSDSTLASCINAARVVLGDSGEEQRLIKTLPRKGIRFVAAVRETLSGAGIAAGQPSQAPDLPTRPSVAVLPFANLSENPDQEHFADGMVEDIITALSQFKSLFVIARNSSFTYKGKAHDIKQVGRELGVRYVLEGSVRKAGGRIRITGQLIEAATGAHLWADKFDGGIEDVFELQDKVTMQVASALFPRLEQAEFERAKRKPPENQDAYELYVRANALTYPLTTEASDQQLTLLHRALEIDPEFAVAHAAAARCYAWRKSQDWMQDRQAECAAAIRLCWSAVEYGREDALAMAWAAYSLAAITGQTDDAVGFADRAIDLNPNLVASWLASGWVRVGRGDTGIAREHFKMGLRLSPRDPRMAGLHVGMALAHFCEANYVEALDHAEVASRRFLQRNTGTGERVHAASLAFLGRLEDAASAIRRLLETDPRRRLSNVRDVTGSLRPEHFARLLEGLRIAGLPD
jgi:TolB-like protein